MKEEQAQKAAFDIVGGKRIYINPRLGKVDLTKPLTNEKAMQCYKDVNFPYVTPNAAAVELLEKEDLDTLQMLAKKASTYKEKGILEKAIDIKAKKEKQRPTEALTSKDTKKVLKK